VSLQLQVVCTIGPATWDREKLFKLADEGMNVARLNMSHGDHASHKKVPAARRPEACTLQHHALQTHCALFTVPVLTSSSTCASENSTAAHSTSLVSAAPTWRQTQRLAHFPIPVPSPAPCQVVDLVKEYNTLGRGCVAIMLDTKGPEVRSGDLAAPIDLVPGAVLEFRFFGFWKLGFAETDCSRLSRVRARDCHLASAVPLWKAVERAAPSVVQQAVQCSTETGLQYLSLACARAAHLLCVAGPSQVQSTPSQLTRAPTGRTAASASTMMASLTT
jgi:Pyruvate kinase, barrel domain